MEDRRLAYLALRLITGIDFFGHGFARIFLGTHLSGFAHSMANSMASTPLPAPLLLLAGYAIPLVELAAGLLLLLGVMTRAALLAALALMGVLMVGITLKQDWSVATQQLTYSLVLSALLFGHESYDLSWPALAGKLRPGRA